MEEELILVKPTMEYEQQAMNFIEEVERFDTDEKIRYSGFGSLQKYKDDYKAWLEINDELEDEKNAHNAGLVPQNIFFSVRKSDNKVVGIVSVRRKLNDALYEYGGHIGYSILPSERRKGYAYKQLVLALKFCKSVGLRRVKVSCLERNIGSARTIEKAGGKLEKIIYSPNKDENKKNYWISLKKRYADKTIGNRVVDTDLKVKSMDDEFFKGDVYFYNFKNVKYKMTIPNWYSILDSNYKWIEFYDYSSRVKLTAMYDDSNKIIQWYFDIAREIGKDNGIPYEDDMYLDVVVTPSGDVILLDEDELKEAFDRKEMTKDEYDEAYKIAYDLMEKIKNNKDKLQEYTDKYLSDFLKG